MDLNFWDGQWLSNSEGFVLGVADGFATVHIEPNPVLAYLQGPAVPAPTGDGCYFAYGFTGVHNACEDRWARAEFGEGVWGPFSWSRTHHEMWYALGYWGEGEVDWLLLPPRIEFPPFDDAITFRVVRTGSCLYLRAKPNPEAATLDCLPDGARLTFVERADPPREGFGHPRSIRTSATTMGGVPVPDGFVSVPNPALRVGLPTSATSNGTDAPCRNAGACYHPSPMPTDRVQLYDTTLRDGAQMEGISLSVEDKVRITRKLDELGVEWIEGGFPGSNPRDAAYFRRLREIAPLSRARVSAFGGTRRAGLTCETDANIQSMVAAETEGVTLVGKASQYQVRRVLETSDEENLAMIADTARYFKALGKTVFFDAEHFFDGFADNPDYSLQCLATAARAGPTRSSSATPTGA